MSAATTVSDRSPAEALHIGVSACLLDEPVRWDGRGSSSAAVELLGPHVVWHQQCPEVEFGMGGVPRPPTRLVERAGVRLELVEHTRASEAPGGEPDLTDAMRAWACTALAAKAATAVHGWVLRSGRPSAAQWESQQWTRAREAPPIGWTGGERTRHRPVRLRDRRGRSGGAAHR